MRRSRYSRKRFQKPNKLKSRLKYIASCAAALAVIAVGREISIGRERRIKRIRDDFYKNRPPPTYGTEYLDSPLVQNMLKEKQEEYKKAQNLQKIKEFDQFLRKVQTLETEVNNYFKNRNLTSDELSILSQRLTGAKIIAEEYKKAGFSTDNLIQRLNYYTNNLPQNR